MTELTEQELETFAINELNKVGFDHSLGFISEPQREDWSTASFIAEAAPPYGSPKRRESFSSVILEDVLESAIKRLNPLIQPNYLDDAFKKVTTIHSPQLVEANEIFHKYLVDGIPVTTQKDGQEGGETVWLIDYQNPQNNRYHVINQFTIHTRNQSKRPDLILFINGLPLILIELKKPGNENSGIIEAFTQLETYKTVIPSLFIYNSLCIISDGFEAKMGTLTTSLDRFSTWKLLDGRKITSPSINKLKVLIKGFLNIPTLLDTIRNFIVFENDKKIDHKTGLIQSQKMKKVAAYHQYHAVNKALDLTEKACDKNGNRKAGVIWHTQGSGKSLSMVFYAGKLVRSLDNPTIVVITDRNDLDQQLFDTFAACSGLLKQAPAKAHSRENLKTLLKVASGGIVFTTIHKFFPGSEEPLYETLSDRRNIIVIADEAHRTQYGFKARLIDTKDQNNAVNGKRLGYGFAKHMRDALPNATFIGFTGTPIESTDKNTPAVFGDYIDIYDIASAVADGATVKIYYESRLAKVNITDEGRRLIEEFDNDAMFDDLLVTQKAKSRWARLETIIGHPERIKKLAQDITTHFRMREEHFKGKAMIVTMSRRIAVALYEEIIALHPEWHSPNLGEGAIKVVMTSASSDRIEYDPENSESLVIPLHHRTNKEDRRTLASRMKDPNDSLKMVIVCDMWLTGFDVPCLHTLYIDKFMKDHALMQAIARVNRVYYDKSGGWIVDYIGIASALKHALSFYSQSGGKGSPAESEEKALELLKEKMEVIRQMFHGFDYRVFFGNDTSKRLDIILEAHEFILTLQNGKERFLREFTVLSRFYALTASHPIARELTDEIAFFQALKARLIKFEIQETYTNTRFFETTIRQIINQAVEATEVVDIFGASGIRKPEISLLSEEFLQDIKNMKHKKLSIELMKKILSDEIRTRKQFNVTEGKKLLEMLQAAINKYKNNFLTNMEIIEELMIIAKYIVNTDRDRERLKLSEEEYAFYSALVENESAVEKMGDNVLADIAREIAEKVRANATIDWVIRESARAKLMRIVKRTLNKHGYPPDKQLKAAETVLKEAEVMADYWMNQNGN